MRVHVWIAKYTTYSRRKAEALVEQGLVTINGQIAKVGQPVELADAVVVEGKRIQSRNIEPVLMALHKPLGYECSHNSETHLSVFELLPKLKSGKWILVGRLDVNTSGLLLVTTDGQLANKLAHPSRGFEREYLVRVSQALSPEALVQLKKGVMLEDGKAKVSHIKEQKKSGSGRNVWYNLVLKEGRNRIVRRLMESQGVQVSRLMRVRFGPIKLDKAMGVGKTQVIDAEWVKDLLK